jgi:osmoprotectant transport system substrate-binding protein
MTALRRLAAPRGLTVLDPGRAVDQNTFAVRASYARQHDLKPLSDLGASELKVRLAAGDECVQRPYCEPGLKKTYGIDVTDVDPKGVGTTQAKRAVQSGQDQLVLTTTTAPVPAAKGAPRRSPSSTTSSPRRTWRPSTNRSTAGGGWRRTWRGPIWRTRGC